MNNEEFENVIAYVAGKSERVRVRDVLAMRLAFETGVRSAEVVREDNFTVKKIRAAITSAGDADTVSFTIIGKGKGAGKPRRIDLPVALAKRLLTYHKEHVVKATISLLTIKAAFSVTALFGSIYRGEEGANPSARSGSGISLRFMDTTLQHANIPQSAPLYATREAEFIRTARGGLGRYDHLRQTMGHTSAETTKIYIHFATNLFGTDEEKNELFEALETVDNCKWNSIRKDMNDE